MSMGEHRAHVWQRIGFVLSALLVCFMLANGKGSAQDQEVVITGREIVERLTRLEEGQKRLEQRVDEVRDFLLWGFGVTFAGIFALVGFVIWDRRTALAPAVRRVEEVQERARRLELALREYAEKEPALAEALRKAGLL
jgi:heme exporter protein D